jgi:phosphatidylcholine synthase
MKTPDASFEGFPGCWNMLALVVFVLQPNPWLVFALSLVLSAAMFLPIRFVHPVRTARWRPLTLTVGTAWMVLAVMAAWGEFGLSGAWAWAFGLTSTYLLLAGPAQQLLDVRGR